jgi:uncharacterized repeat protein (TIGR01451 family)
MLARRVVSLVLLALLLLVASSSLDFVQAVNKPPVATIVCYDGVWEDGEYCGSDAFATTGVPDMNHDCVADGLDLMLFIPIIFSSDPSGDFNHDSATDYTDFIILKHRLGNVASPCNSVPIPNVIDGKIALSFSTDPNTIDDNDIEPLGGSHVVWVVVDNVAGAKAIEYSVQTTPNVILISHFGTTTSEYTNACLPDSLASMTMVLPTPLGPGPQTIAGIQYFINDTLPATIKIVPNDCAGRIRWTEPDIAVSHHFGTMTNAGINGPTPDPTPQTVTPDLVGSVTGNVYADVAGDCVFNAPDYPVVALMEATPGPHLAQTDAAGNYKFWLPPGDYTVKLEDGVNDPWKLRDCQSPTVDVSVTAGNNIVASSFALMPIGTITGRVYRDYDGNCAFNSPDHPIAARVIEVNPGGYLALANSNGDYSLKVPIGSYTVTQATVANDLWALRPCNSPSYSVTVPANGTASGNDFALYWTGPIECDLSVGIYSNGVLANTGCPSNHPWRTPCPGNESAYQFVLKVDPQTPDGVPPGSQLDITLDPAYTISSVTSDCPFSTASSTANTRTILFTNTIDPGVTCVVEVRGTPVPNGGSLYVTQAAFSAGGSCLKTASIVDYMQCACDPNDLSVDPIGCGPGGNILADTPLMYKIRFENVGPGSAHNISIEDVLDANLDVASLTVVASSHPLTGVQIDPGNTLVLSFDGIELAGTLGPGDNKGWVVFAINPMPNLPDGTTIQNTAAITFDFNEPVVTNTTVSTYRTVPEPDVVFAAQNACDGNNQVPTINFTYTGSTPDNATYLWNFGPGATPATSTAQNPSGVLFSTTGTKQVMLTVTRFGCAVSAVQNISASACAFVCHNGTWSDGEYCGYDAYTTTGIPDMNHDCKVDALDLWLLGSQIPSSGANLSGDLNGDNVVNNTDINLLISKYGQSVGVGCNSTVLPDTCEGTIALSFVEYPDFINDNATMSAGFTQHAFIVVKDAPGAKMVSYAVETSPNIVIENHTALNGTIAYACSPGARIVNLTTPLTSSAAFVGMIDFHLTNTSPATMKIKPATSGTACDDHIRWAKSSANRTYNFTFVTNAGINGPTPPPSSNTCTPTAVEPHETPRTDELAQNHPNPFNPETTIQYALSSQEHVTIGIFDIRGALVRTLIDETQPSGWHSVEWNGRDKNGQPVASGVYMYRMTTGSFADTKKLVLLK